MKLKKLKLLGFKSFADEVVLNFDASLVALVGPNGCGKSNIVDAIRWVIGEQSARSMRAGSMQDIIFAGSEKRKELNFAEVSITLSDLDGVFSEVTLTRRLHKNGTYEYLINKQQARLKDLQSIFLNSGLGKSAFSIFEQGKLDEIIYLNPQDRRVIFDEAASISGFLQRKKEALRKLTEVSQNFSRIKDIHSEVDKRLRLLKKQAEEAKEHQKKKERLKYLEKGILAQKLLKLEEKLKNQLNVKKQLEEEIEKKSKVSSDQDIDFQKHKKALFTKEQKIKEIEKKVLHFQLALKGLTNEENNEKTRLLELNAKEKKIFGERQEASKNDLKQQIEKNREKLKEAEAQKNLLEQEWKHVSEEYNKALVTFQSLQDEERKVNKEERKTFEESIFLDKKLQEKNLFKSRFKDDLSSFEAKIEEEKNKVEELGKKEKEKRKLIQALLQDAALLKKEAEVIASELKQNLTHLSDCEKALSSLSLEIKKLNIQESTEGFSKGAKALLKESANLQSSLYGKLKSLCTSIAVSSNHLQEVISYAKKKKITGFCLASLEKGVHDKCLLYFVGEGSEENRIIYLQKVEASLKRFEEELLKEEEKKKNFIREKEVLEKKRVELEEVWRKKEMDCISENFFLQQILQEAKKALEATQKASMEKKKIEEASKAIDEEIATLSADLQKVQGKKKECEEKCSAIQKELLSTMKQRNELQEQRKKTDHHYREALTEYQKTVQEIRILEAKEGFNKAQEKKWEEELLEIAEKKQRSQKTIEEAFSQKANQMALFQAAEEQLKNEEELLKEIVEKQNHLQKESFSERKNLSILEAKYQQIETILAEMQVQKNKLESDFLNRFQERGEEGLDLSLEEAEKESLRLHYELEKGSLINMTSIEESKHEEARFSHLDKQLGDLKEAKEDLEKIIKNLELEARKLFKETFEAIRLNFQKNFALFFNGGKADLKFVGSQDVLEAGIDIVAEPKGKAMRSISLLSGGEKCMTALALLFSIFEVKPAPFCVLDEVDAPLDDANVERFTSVLSQYVESTQFIIVTHNKKTMAKADRLFGVSMEEKGVSKLISIEFEKRETANVSRIGL